MDAGTVKPVPMSQWRAVSQAGVRCDLTGSCSRSARWPGGGFVPMRVRGPCVNPGICSWRQDPGRSAMFRQPSNVTRMKFETGKG